MPEFTKTDFILWLRLSLAQHRPVADVIMEKAKSETDPKRADRALMRFNVWISEGCEE